jgi:hypothetical protein
MVTEGAGKTGQPRLGGNAVAQERVGRGSAMDGGEPSNASDGSLQVGAASMQLSKAVCVSTLCAVLYPP